MTKCQLLLAQALNLSAWCKMNTAMVIVRKTLMSLQNLQMPTCRCWKQLKQFSKRYNVSRDQQDEYGLQSQQRTAAAQEAGRFNDEIVPLASKMVFVDKETKQQSVHDVELEKDEGNRPTTTLEGLSGLKPVFEGGVITAGNASQLSDGRLCICVNG